METIGSARCSEASKTLPFPSTTRFGASPAAAGRIVASTQSTNKNTRVVFLIELFL
jgi:hypothetical protein